MGSLREVRIVAVLVLVRVVLVVRVLLLVRVLVGGGAGAHKRKFRLLVNGGASACGQRCCR